MLERCDQNGNDSNHGQYGRGDAAESRAEFAEDTGACFDSNTQFLHTGRQLHKALHGHADLGNDRAEDNKQWAESRNDQADSQHCFPLAFAHAVQLVHECLDIADDGADGGHQHLTEGNCKLLNLRLENRQLTAEIVLHNSGHLFRHAVIFLNPFDAFLKGLGHGNDRAVHGLDKGIRTAVDCGRKLFNISLAGVHQRQEAGHGVLTDKRLGCGGLLRFGKLRKSPAAIRQDV